MSFMLIKYQVLPAKAGIKALAEQYSRELQIGFLKEVLHQFPGFQVHTYDRPLLWNRTTGQFIHFSGFFSSHQLITSQGCGVHRDNWDPSNWDSQEMPPEVKALWDKHDIPNKVKAYTQDLTDNNHVLQKDAIVQRKYAAQVQSLFKRGQAIINNRNGGFLFEDHFSDFMDCDGYSQLVELVEKSGSYCKGYVKALEACVAELPSLFD